MVIDVQEKLLGALIQCFERVRNPVRDGYHETTYWFDDATRMQVIVYNYEPAHEPVESDTFDYSIDFHNPEFTALMLGI